MHNVFVGGGGAPRLRARITVQKSAVARQRRVVQSRAAETRQQIIDAAIELVHARGYADTGLKDITDRAGITSGAFYYHFESKEELATEIIQQGWRKVQDIVGARTGSPRAGLQGVIAMTFALCELMTRDKAVRTANHLDHALALFTEEGRRGHAQRTAAFVNDVADALADSDLRSGVLAQTVGKMVWITVYGCHRISEAMSVSVFGRLADSWRMLLPSLVDRKRLSDLQLFLTRVAGEFESR